MNDSHNALLQLLRLSLGNTNTVSCDPEATDWHKIYIDSRRQGVSSVAFDSFEKLPTSSRPDKALLIKWLGEALMNEKIFLSYVDTIAQLSSLVERLGFRMILLKGYGCSINYPEPKHRPCGDIDIFLLDSNGLHTKEMQKQLEESLFREYGITIDNANGHHSQFMFHGFLVENHSSILDIDAHKSSVHLEILLEKLISEDSREVEIGGKHICLPSIKFNSIHLLRHMASDFATVKTTLRHVLDWSTMIATNTIEWSFIHEVAHHTNMNRFLDALNGICVHYLGYSEEKFPIEKRDEKMENKVLEEILMSTDSVEHISSNASLLQKYCYALEKTKRMWKNRWKYQIVYDETLLESFWWKAKKRRFV